MPQKRFEWGRELIPTAKRLDHFSEYEDFYYEVISDALNMARRKGYVTDKQIADLTGLSMGTVRNLSQFRVFFPRSDTLFKLTRAVGMQVRMQERPARPAARVRPQRKVRAA